VQGRGEEEHHEEQQEEVRPVQRLLPVPADAALPRGLRGRHRAHPSCPRLLMSLRMNQAATPRIGNMKSETLAPSGMSLPSMPSLNAQVAEMCVWSIGPPAVRMRTMSKFANVTIREKSTVIEMMLRIIGRVTYQIFCHQLAPSISAAS